MMCLFLGDNSQTKGYVCLSPSRKVYSSCYVLFNEIVFPFTLSHKPFITKDKLNFSNAKSNIPIFVIKPISPVTAYALQMPPNFSSFSQSTHNASHPFFQHSRDVALPNMSHIVAPTNDISTSTNHNSSSFVSMSHNAVVPSSVPNTHPMITR